MEVFQHFHMLLANTGSCAEWFRAEDGRLTYCMSSTVTDFAFFAAPSSEEGAVISPEAIISTAFP